MPSGGEANRTLAAASYDVRVFAIRPVHGKKGTTYEVRWSVDGRQKSKTYKTRALADSVRSALVSAMRRGESFDRVTGWPISMLPQAPSVSWYQHACEYVDMKWGDAAPKSRQGIADTFATVTPALVMTNHGRPDTHVLRRALYGWAMHAARRATGPPPDDLSSAVRWVERNTLPVAALEDAAVMRRALGAIATKLDGAPAAASTVGRKRAVLYNSIEYAIELNRLAYNPIDRIKWRAPKSTEVVDRRVVVNQKQAVALLNAVAEIHGGGRLVAFFGCLYYAGLRPAEASILTEREISLPEGPGWGDLLLDRSDPNVGHSWRDGERVPRPLKHRADREVRAVPCPPPLVRLLRHHLGEYGTDAAGRLFRGARGGPLSDTVYGRVWQSARDKALTPAEAASPLAGRPYDLRHAAVSTWLNEGVPATQAAEWAGHSVAVLHRVYAKCLVGQDEAARRRLDKTWDA